jgi:thymidylate synthase
LGPVYGFQWRHFGAEYVDGKLDFLKIANADYSGKGVDQLRYVLDKIVNEPTNRRILLCAWNPKGKSKGLIFRSSNNGSSSLSYVLSVLCGFAL